MVAPSTANLSASSDCDRGERAFAAMAIVIQLAWLTPKYFKRRSTAWRQDREVLCSASLNRSSRSLIHRTLMVSYLSNISQNHPEISPLGENMGPRISSLQIDLAAMKMLAVSCLWAVLFAVPTRSIAEALDVVVVTATRIPEPADQIPADISVVSGREIAARGAADMAAVLSLVPGVEAPPGGDAGPSSAVPSFWGLHEFDAFLLVVDDVPWGGAFNPAISTLNLTDVERIEILKGAAPVMYGATSFVGVVHVLHYPAGESANAADISVGNYRSARGSAAFALPQWGDFHQSFAASGESLGFADQ